LPGARKVLRAAALTYVAAALQAVGTVLYYMMILSRSRRRSF
jgi:Zn-dependent membrane protease YugP